MTVDLSAIKRKNQEFWEKCFDKSDCDYQRLAEKDWKPLIQWLHENDVRNILDLGCGYGHWSIVLARAGFSVKAVDYARSAIGILKKWSTEESLVIDCEINTVQDIISESEFDAVICNSVLDHMMREDAQVAMSNIGRVLKRGGIAYVSFDGPEKDSDTYTILDDGTRHYIAGEFKNMLWRFYTDEEIRGLCGNFRVMRFNTQHSGKRDIWIQKL
jgi:2-polyprenyl-3-methyl-5-hydroxy-6-metoxy-1,4-benzoquinol methylase